MRWRSTVEKIFWTLCFVVSCFALLLVHRITLTPSEGQFKDDSPLNRHAWPPVNLAQLIDPITGRYDLQLRPRVQLDEESMLRGARHYEMLRLLYTGPVINGSWLRKAVRMEEAVIGASSDYELYPQIIDLPETVRAIRAGRAVGQAPINDPSIQVIRHPSHLCHRRQKSNIMDVMVVIKSCVTCFKARIRARKTFMQPQHWANLSVKFVFVTGLPNENNASTMTMDGFIIDTHVNAHQDNTTAREQRESLMKEAVQYDDLLIGDFTDHYFNLTLKMIFTFRWISAFCKNQSLLYLFIDDDYTIIPKKLTRLIEQLKTSDEVAHLNIGLHHPNPIVIRPRYESSIVNSRWAVSEDEIPWRKYLGSSMGIANLIGSELVLEAAIGSAFVRSFRIDDMYLGIVWNKLGRHIFSHRDLISTKLDGETAVMLHT